MEVRKPEIIAAARQLAEHWKQKRSLLQLQKDKLEQKRGLSILLAMLVEAQHKEWPLENKRAKVGPVGLRARLTVVKTFS